MVEGLENGNFCLLSVHKTCLRRVQKALKCAYVIYEWSHTTVAAAARKNVYVFMLIKLRGQMHFDGRE